MGGTSSILKPQELTEFRKLNTTTTDNVEIPARPESRTLTDKKGFLIFGIGFVIFLGFFIFALVKADVNRLFFGYDNCGNMCGLNNSKISGVPCSGKNYEHQRYYDNGMDTIDFFGYNYLNSKCVSSCSSGRTSIFMDKCLLPEHGTSNPSFNFDSYNNDFSLRHRRDVYTDNFNDKDDIDFEATLKYCRTHWWKFLLSIIITIALCLVVLFLLRFVPAIVVWGVLILGLLAAIAISGAMWYIYFSKAEKDERKGTLVGAIIVTILTLIILIVFIVLFKKIRLVVQLYKETTKAVFAMPFLIVVPLVITLFQVIIFIALILTTVYIFTSRQLKSYPNDRYQYEFTGVLKFVVAFNFIMTSWAMHFIAGIQYMTISGAVAAWYFARNKQYLDSPILTSLSNTFKFHLGSICLGSSILTIMDIIRALIKAFVDNDKMRWILECCCSNIEAFLKFLSKNAYIETSIHGQSFLRSGKRAAKLLLNNAASVIAINSVGDFVLGMIVFILIVISTCISVALFKDGPNYWFPSVIMFIVNIIIIALTFAIFETTIDTLFICFCEDKEINDGISKPYFMSRGLMEFVENSKKIYGDKQR